ncbi:ankyrin repeat domain-containing protein 12 isoform X3 [Photinus pyralis]|uniref:ankyrin repeat domain-containing protein 12 isoform X3 n=1 Tax=Photinus pyralis TaxID=7054 RepID=UPI0012677F0D|nr:ankyrin repeat domain-containing protein 12 isoform X3 [Photinus pyralis]
MVTTIPKLSYKCLFVLDPFFKCEMPSSVRPKIHSSVSKTPTSTPMSERQQMALLMQMASHSRSPSSRSKDRNERGETPLHLAAIKGDVEQVCKLLSHHADPNVADFAGWTPLHEACNHGWFEVACRLVQAGANVNARGFDDDTPLHDAAVNGHLKLAQYLLEKGADTGAKNSKGKTPFDVSSPSVAALLLNSDAVTEPTISTRQQPRLRDEKKLIDSKQKNTTEETMDSSKTTDDVYEFKSVKDSCPSPENKPQDSCETEKDLQDGASTTSTSQSTEENAKRTFSEVADADDAADDESKKKKRKDDTAKETKAATPQRNVGLNKAQLSKQATTAPNKTNTAASVKSTERKTPPASPKPATSDQEVEDGKSDLKVPPLKIVIPQSTSEQESGSTRNGKNNSQRSHQALPYVVASSNNESSEKDATSGTTSPTETPAVKNEEKKEQTAGSDDQVTTSSDTEPTMSTSGVNSTATMNVVELHPRKRKMKPSKETSVPPPAHEPLEAPAVSEIHPHEQPITNCYQLFLNIRKQIDKRRKGLIPVQPKPPQGFKDYLMNRCTYVLAGNAPTTPNITIPANLPAQMKDLYSEQEKERYRLRMQHVIEKEKLVLSVEQEILRVHGRAARALANQSLPFSVCTILRDEEVYNLITPEQEEKDRNARSRYNGRLFLSWLQDVDDKWEKIKEHMLLRHHNEAESLHAVQKMDWEWKLKELNLCDAKTTPSIDELHVPMVHVSDDFDLLPA